MINENNENIKQMVQYFFKKNVQVIGGKDKSKMIPYK